MDDFAEYFYVAWGYGVGAFLGFIEGLHLYGTLLQGPLPGLVAMYLIAPPCGLVGAFAVYRLLD
jgi:hypothetical protein